MFQPRQEQVTRRIGRMNRIVAAATVRMDPGNQPAMGLDDCLAPSRAVHPEQGPRPGFSLGTL